MKPKFIFSLGIGWSGTTSLYHTLKNMKYVHTGPTKEIQALHTFYINETNNVKLDTYNSFLEKLLLCGNFDDKRDPHGVLNKITEKDFNYILGPSKSLEKYIKYYLNLYQYLEGNYQAVGDFSNISMTLSEQNLIEIVNKMSKYFEIKCLVSLRDPIRRAWSHAGSFTNLDETRNFYYLTARHSFNFKYTTGDIIKSFEKSAIMNFVSKINTYYKVFGKENVCYLIMEDLYNPNNQKEKEKLENFLSIKIDQMYPCCYVPDKGINAPKDDQYLKDQWDSDHHILTSEMYNRYREREDFKKEYLEFENFHGSLPADWGSPIDYGY